MSGPTIASGIRDAARRDARKIALTTSTATIDYGTLVGNINRISNLAQHHLGLERGARAVLIAPNGIRFIEVFLGLAEAGVAVTPVSLLATPGEVTRIADDLGARTIFVDPAFRHLAEARHPIALDGAFDALLAKASDQPPDIALTDADTFCIPYTSGSSGTPKGVMLSHRARVDHMRFGMAANWGVHGPAARVLATSPFFNGGAVIQPIAALYFGGSCHIMDKFDAEEVLREVGRRQITFMSLVPTQYHRILQLSPATLAAANLNSLQAVASFGAPMTPAAKRAVIALLGEGKLYDSYGTTEAGSIACLRPEDQLRKPGSVGRATPGVEIKLAGANNEILCRSSWLFSGYWNNAAASAESLQDGWAATGDLGRVDDEGCVYLLDRKSNVIISGGQNIYPREVENALAAHPAVFEAAVVGRKDEEWGEVVTAVIVLKPGHAADGEDMKQHCSTTLAKYKVPKGFVFWPCLPHNATGKIDHRAIRATINSA
jgi:acyl-CoA synthetase (AMP-forming)/AMP-acid ligase II